MPSCDVCVSLQEGTTVSGNCDSLKYAAVTSMPSNTTTARTVSNTLFLLEDLSFWVFGAVMGLLWRPGRGTTGKKKKENIREALVEKRDARQWTSEARKEKKRKCALHALQAASNAQHYGCQVFNMIYIYMKPTPNDSLPGCLGFNGLVLSSGSWAIVWGKNKKKNALDKVSTVSKQQCASRGLRDNIQCA